MKFSIRLFIVTLCISLLALIFNTDLFASDTPQKEDSIKERYQQAKFYYNQLETTGTLGKNRKNWIKGTSNFRRIYLSSPKSEYAPACLYMLGKIYFRMYKRFNTGIDLGESLSYYRDTTSLFPNNRLADDALFAVGTIFLEETKDPKKAAAAFSTIVSNYPNGDMYSQAATLLKTLSKDYNIPLPAQMVGNSLKDLHYVLPVKYWSSKDYTRVVIKASGPVTYHEQLLEKSKNKPRRLYIDFRNSYIEPKYRAPVPIQNGLLKQIRTGQYSPDTVRVVLDIESISDYNIFSLPDPFRVVIDVKGKTAKLPTEKVKIVPKKQEEAVIANHQVIVLRDNKKRLKGKYKQRRSETKAAALPKPAKPVETTVVPVQSAPSLAQQLGLGVKKIVLDPGHGGKDPGAIGFGLQEKDIVLKLAKMLVPKLENETGAQVILTRDKDMFIPLEERTAIANASGADLFVSLHINAHPSPKVKGLETYYLNLSTNAEAMRVAARENAISTHQMSDLQDILSDIMKNSKITESSRLAQQVHSTLINGIIDNQNFSNTKNLGVKQAPFYVLIGAEMPSILLELGFISNEQEVKYLQDDQYLDLLSNEIAIGIKQYINSTTAAASI